MTKVSWRSWAVGLGCSLLATSVFAQSPTMAVKAVKLNPTCVGGTRAGQNCVLAPDCPGGSCGGDIAPTSTLSVSPGDIIVTEVFAEDYSPAGEQLQAYQFGLGDSFAASVRGGVAMLEAPRRCSVTNDCTFISISAVCSAGVCIDNPALDSRAGSVNVDLTLSRFDFVFFTKNAFVSVGLDLDQVRFLGALSQGSDSAVYPGSPRYLGTVAYKVGPEMCGTVEISLQPDTADTVLVKRGGQFIIPVLSPLTLTGPSGLACDCLNIVDSDPPNCVIEARQPFNPDGSGAVTLNSIRLRMDCPDASGITSTEDFSVRELRSGFIGNFVSSIVVDPADKSWLTLTFGRSLKAERWTCTAFGFTGGEVCVGLLAGDVNVDSLVGDEDIVDLAATTLNGGPDSSCVRNPGTCTLRQCDADRSELCTPADILRVVDIINGGGAFGALGVDMGIITNGGAPISCPTLP